MTPRMNNKVKGEEGKNCYVSEYIALWGWPVFLKRSEWTEQYIFPDQKIILLYNLSLHRFRPDRQNFGRRYSYSLHVSRIFEWLHHFLCFPDLFLQILPTKLAQRLTPIWLFISLIIPMHQQMPLLHYVMLNPLALIPPLCIIFSFSFPLF